MLPLFQTFEGFEDLLALEIVVLFLKRCREVNINYVLDSSGQLEVVFSLQTDANVTDGPVYPGVAALRYIVIINYYLKPYPVTDDVEDI